MKKVFEALPGNGVLLATDAPRFTVLAVTEGVEAVSGRSGLQLIGKGLFESFPENPDNPAADGERTGIASLQSVLAHKEEHRLPLQRYDLPDGKGGYREQWWSVVNRPVIDEAGAVQFIIHTSMNITAEVLAGRMQEQVKSMALVNSLFMETPIAIAILRGPQFVVELANKPLIEVWGKGPDVLGKPILEVMPEIEKQGFVALMEKVVAENQPFHAYEMPVELVRNGRNETVYFNFSYQPYHEPPHAEPQGILIFASEVTKEVATRRKLDESERHLELLSNTVPAMIFYLDREQRYRTYNETFMSWFGVNKSEAIGKTVQEFIGEKAYRRVRPHLEVAYSGRQERFEMEAPQRIGANRWLSIVYTPHKDYEGRVLGVIVHATDITDRMRAQQKIEEEVVLRTRELAKTNKALAEANRELKRSNQNLEEFAHAASHDLKEPIRKIHFFTNQLKGLLSDHLSESELRSFNRIESATQRMGSLIEDLLLYSHVSQLPHEKEDVDLNQVLQHVLEDLELDIHQKHATVSIGTLPVVRGYRRQLQQLFQNLLSNALKYSRENVPPVIDISSRRAAEPGGWSHQVRVQDNGIGIEPEYRDKIFQMFTRLHGRNEYSGTGVGLAIVKKIIENHEGYVCVESTKDRGSTFIVKIPVE